MKVCLANLHEATEQGIFNQVWERAKDKRKAQGKVGDVTVCKYRTDDGIACFGGCLIADEEYKPEMDDNGPNGEVNTDWQVLTSKGIIPDYHSTFIRSLQTIHDRREPNNWQQELKSFARMSNLKVPE